MLTLRQITSEESFRAARPQSETALKSFNSKTESETGSSKDAPKRPQQIIFHTWPRPMSRKNIFHRRESAGIAMLRSISCWIAQILRNHCAK